MAIATAASTASWLTRLLVTKTTSVCCGCNSLSELEVPVVTLSLPGLWPPCCPGAAWCWEAEEGDRVAGLASSCDGGRRPGTSLRSSAGGRQVGACRTRVQVRGVHLWVHVQAHVRACECVRAKEGCALLAVLTHANVRV